MQTLKFYRKFPKQQLKQYGFDLKLHKALIPCDNCFTVKSMSEGNLQNLICSQNMKKTVKENKITDIDGANR